MREVLILFVHLITTVIRLAKPVCGLSSPKSFWPNISC